MKRKGTNRKDIAPGLPRIKAEVIRRVQKLSPWALKILKRKPYLVKATYIATVEAARNYLHQTNMRRLGLVGERRNGAGTHTPPMRSGFKASHR